MRAVAEGRLRGATRWAGEAAQLVDEHLAQERAVVESYERFAEKDLPELPRYLIRLVVEDEKRHHRVMAELARTLDDLSGKPTPGSLLPSATEGTAPPGLLEESERFLEIERADTKELRRLLKAMKVRPDHRLWDLLLSASDEEPPDGEDPEAWQQAAQPLDSQLLADSTLWQLLVHMQLLDTKKHELILEFIRDWCSSHSD